MIGLITIYSTVVLPVLKLSGALLWTGHRNSLPENIQTLQSFAPFRKAVNKYYNSSNELPHGNLVNQIIAYILLSSLYALFCIHVYTEDSTVYK